MELHQIVLAVVAYVFLFEIVVSWKKIPKEKIPQPFRLQHIVWGTFSHALGAVMSRVILTILWLVGFGIYGVAMKIIMLFKRPPGNPETYWHHCEPLKNDHLKYQF